MDYHVWRKLAWPLFPVVTAMLILCYFMPPVNDAHRWIFIGSFQFQPSELAKFSLVLLFSHLLVSNEKSWGGSATVFSPLRWCWAFMPALS